jgi:hypothetical protein
MFRLVSSQPEGVEMQRALHNHATLRVADTTDGSSTLTADEVNIDRIYNCIRKVCASVAATLSPSSNVKHNKRGEL